MEEGTAAKKESRKRVSESIEAFAPKRRSNRVGKVWSHVDVQMIVAMIHIFVGEIEEKRHSTSQPF